MNDYIVTEIERENKKFIAAAFYEDRRLTELSVMPEKEESRVGKIYVGYVESVAKNIGGAFIRISKDFKCFLPDYKRAVASNKNSNSKTIDKPSAAQNSDDDAADPHRDSYRANDQGHMLIRITKDAAGVKEAVCSTSIELAGKYCVISHGKTSVSISKKLGEEERELLKKWVNPHDFPGFHILLRTNAAAAQKKDILDEISALAASLTEIMRKAETAGPGACLYSPEPFYISMLRDLYVLPDRAFSEIPRIAEELDWYLRAQEASGIPANLHDGSGADASNKSRIDASASAFNSSDVQGNSDDRRRENVSGSIAEPSDIPDSLYQKKAGALTLSQLYNLEHDLDRLLQKIVWLKSGAYLVIEQTEAFVVIDVNTGRCNRGRIPEETYRKINLEAGEEILRQLRLRELSGMILIDFINLQSEDHRLELVQVMKKLARREHRRTDVYDLTHLGILEMSREKRGKPLDAVLGEGMKL
ncbi:MAG: ribonuclease E/G [Lachnospiraceae bacterium]|nr:ribonuclease E/G [Lachnospiraceae bacterium]